MIDNSVINAPMSADYIRKIETHVDDYMYGKEFNELFPDIEFVKLTNNDEKHNGYQYYDGLNIDVNEFNNDYYCSKGGFYFTIKPFAHKWVIYRPNDVMHHIRRVTIPNDAKVFIEDYGIFKTDKFILDKKEPISTDMYVNYVKFKIKYNISYSTNEYLCDLFATIRNNEFYLECTRFNYHALQYIPIDMLNEEICGEALKQFWYCTSTLHTC